MFDLIIRGGAVYDGTGRPARWADVAVSGGKIAAVEPLPQAQAARVIDARGKWVTPGFIDIHRHADAAAFRPGFGELELRQGLTTIVSGNCGLSCAPVGPENLPAILSYLEPICGRVPPEAAQETLAGYFAAQPAAPLHTGMLVGAGTVRASVAGYQVQRLEPAHYAAIHRRLEQALADGINRGGRYGKRKAKGIIRNMENLRANHFESRDSGLNKNEFNLSAKSGRSVGKGKLCAAKIIRVVTVPPVFAALLTTILYIAMGDAAFANRFHYAEAVFSLSLLPVVPYALCAVIPALKKRGRKFERTVALIFSVTGYFMGAAFAFFGGGVQVEKVMFATYLCSGLLLAILSFIFKYRASGHACGVAGPVAMLTAYLGAAFLPAALLLVPIGISSVRLGRHTVLQVIIGSAVSVVSFCAMYLLVPALGL